MRITLTYASSLPPTYSGFKVINLMKDIEGAVTGSPKQTFRLPATKRLLHNLYRELLESDQPEIRVVFLWPGPFYSNYLQAACIDWLQYKLSQRNIRVACD